MKVFSVFQEPLAGIVRIWAQSWSARGWTPQLISDKELAQWGTPKAAANARGGGIVVDVRVINFSYPSRRHPRKRIVQAGKAGWLSAPLVRFPVGVTEEAIRECGRKLWP